MSCTWQYLTLLDWTFRPQKTLLLFFPHPNRNNAKWEDRRQAGESYDAQALWASKRPCQWVMKWLGNERMDTMLESKPKFIIFHYRPFQCLVLSQTYKCSMMQADLCKQVDFWFIRAGSQAAIVYLFLCGRLHNEWRDEPQNTWDLKTKDLAKEWLILHSAKKNNYTIWSTCRLLTNPGWPLIYSNRSWLWLIYL